MSPHGIELPDNYQLHSTLDPKNDKAATATIKVAFALILAALIILTLVVDLPFDNGLSLGITVALTVAACLVYLVVHQLTHAVLLWGLTRVRPTITVRLLYLTTGSKGILTRGQAVLVALAPLLVYPLVLLDFLRSLPTTFFLTFYVVLVLNVASSAGDVLKAHAIVKLPSTALIRDDGKETTVFLPID